MKKIKLDVNDLRVESFVTSALGEEDAVFAMSPTQCGDTCNGISLTCAPGCNPSGQCDLTGGGESCTDNGGTTGTPSGGCGGPTEDGGPSCTLEPC